MPTTANIEHRALAIACLSGALLCAGEAMAEPMRVTPSLRVAQTYVDNVSLSRPGREEDDFVTEIAPSVTVVRETPRLDLEAYYQLEYLQFLEEPDSSQTFHQAQGHAAYIAVPDWFFIDGALGFGQQVISAEEPVPLNNLTTSDNRTDYVSWSFNPYLEHRGPGAELLASYEWGGVEYQRAAVSDYRQTDGRVRLQNREGERRLWGAEYRRRELDPDQGSEAVLSTLEGRLGLALTAKLAVSGVVGYEENDFSGVADEEGDYWAVDTRFDPTTRTRIEARYGRRYFGDTGSLYLRTRNRTTEVSASYAEEFTSGAEVLVGRSGAIDSVARIPSDTGLDTAVYFGRRWMLRSETETGRSTLALFGYRELRDYETLRRDERVFGVGGDWAWRVAPLSTLYTELERQEREFERIGRDDTVWVMDLRLEQRLTAKAVGGVGWFHTRRDSSDPAAEYRQNMLTIFARMTF